MLALARSADNAGASHRHGSEPMPSFRLPAPERQIRPAPRKSRRNGSAVLHRARTGRPLRAAVRNSDTDAVSELRRLPPDRVSRGLSNFPAPSAPDESSGAALPGSFASSAPKAHRAEHFGLCAPSARATARAAAGRQRCSRAGDHPCPRVQPSRRSSCRRCARTGLLQPRARKREFDVVGYGQCAGRVRSSGIRADAALARG